MASKRKPRKGPGSADLVAWLIFAMGAVAFGRALFQEAERARTVREAASSRARVESRIAESEPARPHPTAHAGPPVVAAPAQRPTATPTPPAPGSDPQHPSGTTDLPRRERPRDLLAGRSQPAAGARAELAIIIDDVGNSLEQVERLRRLPIALTIAVIPHLTHSREAADQLRARGCEIMLHLPMEPVSYPADDPGAGAILVAMNGEQVRAAVLRDMAAIPHIRGINNHMGSRATADVRVMRSVLETVATTPYFFIDSRTTEGSVALAVARELNIPSAQRSVFLDDTISTESVLQQLRRAADIARKSGQAIAIGHPHTITLDALARELPRMKRDGIQFVFASKLVS